MEDAENTEHDISAVASSLEGNPVVNDIVDQLLDRATNDSSRTYSEVASGRNHRPMEIDDLTFEQERDATVSFFSSPTTNQHRIHT